MLASIPSEIKYYSGLATLPSHYKTYMAIRSADTLGSGHVTLDVKEISKKLDIQRQTVTLHLKKCCEDGLFYHIDWQSRHIVHVYYVCLSKVVRAKGIDDVGLETLVPLETFRTHLRTWLFECEMMNAQNQSYYRMVEEQSRIQNTNHPKVPTLKQIFEKRGRKPRQSSDFMPGASAKNPIYAAIRCLFAHYGFPMFGAKQESVAEKIGFSSRTLSRHFSHTWREERGIDDLTKYQLCVATGMNPNELKTMKGSFAYPPECDRLFRVGRGEGAIVFWAGCNLYDSKVTFKCQSRTRKRVKKHSKYSDIPSLIPISYLSSLDNHNTHSHSPSRGEGTLPLSLRA